MGCGGTERESKKCFLKIVDKRDSDTHLNVIKEFVPNGTIIVTDSWRGYGKLKNANFNHYCVNHSFNFVDPLNRAIHTQNIGSLWSKLNRDMRRRVGRLGVSRFETYLVEYQLRNIHTSNEELFLDIIKGVSYTFYPFK